MIGMRIRIILSENFRLIHLVNRLCDWFLLSGYICTVGLIFVLHVRVTGYQLARNAKLTNYHESNYLEYEQRNLLMFALVLCHGL